MKKFLMIVGGFVLLILLLNVAALGYAAIQGSGLDKSSKEYIDSTIPQIIKEWNMDVLNQNIDKSAMANAGVTDEYIKKLFYWFRTLGKMTKYNESKGEAGIIISNIFVKTITAKYIVSAEFEKGHADISVVLSYKDNNWKISGFNVNSPALANALPSK